MATQAKFFITAVDNTQRAVRSVQHNMSRMGRSVNRVSRSFASLAAISGGAFAVRGIVDAGIALERFERSLKFATGSAEAGAREMAFVRAEASRLGLDLEETAGAYTKLAAASRGTNLEGEQTREIFTAISEASRVMGLSAEQTGGALTAIEQMISKGNVQAEELRGQLGERLPGAFQIAARAMGITTVELNKMLDNGEVLADELLPALASELRRTFAPEVAAAANDAQAAISRFNTAIFDLQATIAGSGVLDFLSDMADFTRRIAGGETAAEKIDRITKAIEQWKTALPSASADRQIAELRRQLIAAIQEMPVLTGRTEELTAAQNELGETTGDVAGNTDDYQKTLDQLNKRYQTTAQRIEVLRSQLREFGADLNEGVAEGIRAEIDRLRMEGLEEIVIDVQRRFTAPVKAEMEEISEASKQAARNIQDAFAEFFFDPFDKGLKGVVEGFLNAMRTMLANKAATEAFNFLSSLFNNAGGGGGLSRAIGKTKSLPGKKDGGSWTVGGVGGADSQLVAFKASPGERVSVSKGGGGSGNVNINQTIDARGADEARIMRVLPPILEQSREQTKAEIMQLRMEGRFA